MTQNRKDSENKNSYDKSITIQIRSSEGMNCDSSTRDNSEREPTQVQGNLSTVRLCI